ncbi:hypothetical protein NC652_020766 [Populus alba x Populus x berolinensis]|uniref:Uncharacterized protein n=1 Tax=Populus alba x Populus x berolinensis TaxID=444605 RepID=A0AAD6MKQ1_9ROSI|nr:hypothetical protein NC652_020766 [Populus alba x Populus x berolinensis]KAJ6987379.1 hypothetical protein NC653_020588 [Populus alba x Populus x berolinensis]
MAIKMKQKDGINKFKWQNGNFKEAPGRNQSERGLKASRGEFLWCHVETRASLGSRRFALPGVTRFEYKVPPM